MKNVVELARETLALPDPVETVNKYASIFELKPTKANLNRLFDCAIREENERTKTIVDALLKVAEAAQHATGYVYKVENNELCVIELALADLVKAVETIDREPLS